MFKRIRPTKTDQGTRIDLAAQTIRGTVYGVAPCYVRIGHTQRPAVALKAGDDKSIVEGRLAAARWLRARGLSYREAQSFIREGMLICKFRGDMREDQ
jgi:hypothetical protein